ncbi:MAG TPA: hypothetical protein VMM84_08120 [Pyrinomonadaceae bacterium]|nr:hypothetical protein [Pyrinomonadaceae bacterium]
MKRDVVSGTLLIASSVVSMIVMSLHPTAHGLMNRETFLQTARLSLMIHALAIAATPVMFLGLLGVIRRLRASDLSIAALVAFGFGGTAVISAALASGFIFPGVISRIVAAEGSDLTRAFLVYTGLWNRAFASVYVIAFAVGIILLSATIIRQRTQITFGLVTGVAGLIAGSAILIAFLSGVIHLDVHGARILWFVQSGWTLWLGIIMCLKPTRTDLDVV